MGMPLERSAIAGQRPGAGLWLLWAVVTVAASIPAVFAGWYVYEYVRSAWAPFPALILEGVTIWVIVACVQTLILKRQWPRMKWWEWIAANAAGAAVGSWPILIYASNPPFLLHVAASACMGGSCVGFLGGLILGAAQWVVLSGQEHNVGMWGWVSPVSISAGAMVGLLVAWQYLPEVFTLGTVLPVLSTVVAIFAVNGVMTGFALVTMLRSR